MHPFTGFNLVFSFGVLAILLFCFLAPVRWLAMIINVVSSAGTKALDWIKSWFN